jgi:hypothetical protein
MAREPGPEGAPSNREILTTYLGLHEAPPRRPDWRPHALWVGVLAAIFIALVVPGQTGLIGKAVGVIAALFFCTIVFMTAVRSQYVKLLERHGPGEATPTDEPGPPA